MNMSEAARTGRRFHRKSEPDRWYLLEGKYLIEVQPIGPPIKVAIDAEMLVATDWNAEPLKLEITADDLMRAGRELQDLLSKRKLSGVEVAKLLAVELGLLEEEPK